MKNETEKHTLSFSCEEMDARERIWYFNDYAAELCLTVLEGFICHTKIPTMLRGTYEEARFALRFLLENEEEQVDMQTCVRVQMGLHSFAICLPFMSADYLQVDDDAYAQASSEIACRLLPVLKDFAGCSQFPPAYFCRIYMDEREQCREWDEALWKMIEAFEYLACPEQGHDKEKIRKMEIGLHLFAEYLPEMCNS